MSRAGGHPTDRTARRSMGRGAVHPMGRIVARRLVRFVLLMLAVSFVAFALVSASPIDPVSANVGQAAYATMSEAKRAQLASYWGTDLPFWQRYANWLLSALHGDLGISLRFNEPVTSVLAERAGNTLALMAVAWVASGVIGFSLGIVAGLHRDGVADRVIKGVCFVFASTPAFWFGLVMLIVFSVWLKWFPMGLSASVGVSAADATLGDRIAHLVLPAMTLSIIGVANIALHTREKMIDIMDSEYVRFACARGMTRMQAARVHGPRNLVLPAITLEFASLSEIFGGSVLVEQVFSYPGLGQAAITAGVGGDVALLVGIALVASLIVFTGNMIADILYGVVDPRIRRGGGAL